MLRRFALCAALALGAATAARSAELVVAVSGAQAQAGDIACALFSGASGFPLSSQGAKLQRAPYQSGRNVCRYTGLKPGVYAVAAVQLPPGRNEVERDLLGRPKDRWGVSNNVRHAMSAPKFEESAFTVAGEGATQISVALGF